MYRVELKVEEKVEEYKEAMGSEPTVPNVPCGVERFLIIPVVKIPQSMHHN